jgi:hypothetical protein
LQASPCVFLASGPCGSSKSSISINARASNNRPMMEPSENHDVRNGEAVTFPDPNFEQAIRKALGKARGRVYRSELAKLTRLGLELCNKQISDISPLVMLPWLTWLDVSENQVSRIYRSCLGMLMMFRAPRLVRRCCWSISTCLLMLLARGQKIP